MNGLLRCFFALAFVGVGAAGCSTDHAPPEQGPERSEGDLTVDLRGGAHVRLTEHAAKDGTVDVELSLARGEGVADPGATLTATGRIERFPEAGLRLYTARFTGAARAGSPCADKPMTLALALTRRLDNARVSGALTAYCEGSVDRGTPARLLRLAGNAPLQH